MSDYGLVGIDKSIRLGPRRRGNATNDNRGLVALLP